MSDSRPDAGRLSALREFVRTFPDREHTHDDLLRRFVFAAVIIILLEGAYIIFLQVQLLELESAVSMQETRIAQAEQDYDRHNHMLYSLNETVTSIQRQWTSLNFRVLENTWKLDGITPQAPADINQ